MLNRMPAPGDYVRLGVYIGAIKDVYTAPGGKTLLKVYFVKNAFQRNLPEYQEVDATHDIALVEAADVKAEIGRYMRMLRESLQENFPNVLE